jgi:hypothetical protein
MSKYVSWEDMTLHLSRCVLIDACFRKLVRHQVLLEAYISYFHGTKVPLRALYISSSFLYRHMYNGYTGVYTKYFLKPSGLVFLSEYLSLGIFIFSRVIYAVSEYSIVIPKYALRSFIRDIIVVFSYLFLCIICLMCIYI